jgi:hypothetical protein
VLRSQDHFARDRSRRASGWAISLQGSRQQALIGERKEGSTVKCAAIADVHGNFIALEAVLADITAAGITEIVNLGDHVSGPLEAR